MESIDHFCMVALDCLEEIRRQFIPERRSKLKMTLVIREPGQPSRIVSQDDLAQVVEAIQTELNAEEQG